MVAPMTTYVPTFQGLSAFELVRPPVSTPPCFPFTARAARLLSRAQRDLLPVRGAAIAQPQPGRAGPGLQQRQRDPRAEGRRRDAALLPHRARHAARRRSHRRTVPRVTTRMFCMSFTTLAGRNRSTRSSRICRERAMLLVEDCALSLLSEPDGRPLGASGDFSVFCLYKTLPVPNGSVLVQNKMPLGALGRLRLRRAGAASVLGRVAELVVQRTRAQINGVGAILQSAKRALGKAAGALEVNRSTVGDIGFNFADVDLQMSPASERLLRRFDFGTIRRKRVDNFHTLAPGARRQGHAGPGASARGRLSAVLPDCRARQGGGGARLARPRRAGARVLESRRRWRRRCDVCQRPVPALARARAARAPGPLGPADRAHGGSRRRPQPPVRLMILTATAVQPPRSRV